MHNKFYQMLGITRKSGKLMCGYNNCLEALKHKKINLIIISDTCSQNTLERFEYLCTDKNVKLIKKCSGEELSSMLGYEKLSVVGICDKGIGEKLMILWTENNNKQ